MIIYNKTWLANLRLQTQLKRDAESGNITADELRDVLLAYPVGFYTPHLMIRIGLFLLTCVIVSFAESLITMFFYQTQIITGFAWFIALGILICVCLEFVVKKISHYRSGVDDALLVIAGCQIAAGFGALIFDAGPGSFILLSVFVFVIAAYLTARFADMLAAMFTCLSFFAMIFFSWTKLIPAGLATAPFVMMTASGVAYWLANKYSTPATINYVNCLIVAQVISLLALYASGNYYVIQTLSTDMAGRRGPVPFGTVFWVWMIAMPFVYIGIGIRKKDVILLRSGLLLIAAAAVTFRNYYHVLPVDIGLIIVGAVILAIVYGVSKYLKTPKHGFTTTEPDEVNLMDHLKVESLIVAETFSHAPAAPTDGSKFGGGSFGGGGSTGEF
jgi:hypothetical protein